MMDINEARRIVAFVDTWGQSFSRLADELEVSTTEARLIYSRAKNRVNIVDARATVRKLNELAAQFNLSAESMIAAFA